MDDQNQPGADPSPVDEPGVVHVLTVDMDSSTAQLDSLGAVVGMQGAVDLVCLGIASMKKANTASDAGARGGLTKRPDPGDA